jgi:hypothetical protein
VESVHSSDGAEATTNLIYEGWTFSVLRRVLIANCDIFEDDPTLLTRPYTVKWRVSAVHFYLFIKALEGSDPVLTHESAAALRLLCNEFKFVRFGSQVQTFVDRWAPVVFGDTTVYVLSNTLVQSCSRFRDS